MIYGCSGCKFRSTALEEVKAHHAVAHKSDRGGSARRGKRAKQQQPAKPLEVILIDSDDDESDDDESGSGSDDDSGDESDDSFGGGAEITTTTTKAMKAASTRDGDYEPQNRRKRKSDEMTAQSKSAAAAPPKAKRASTAASVKQEQQEPSREQPTKRPIVKQEPKDSSAGVQKEKEDAKARQRPASERRKKEAELAEAKKAKEKEKAEERRKANERAQAEERRKAEERAKAAEAKKAAESAAAAAKKAASIASAAAASKRQRQESDKSSRSGAPAATVVAFRCAMCGGQAGSAGEYQIHLFGRHEMLWCRPCDFRHHEDGMANHFRSAHGSDPRITYAMMVDWNEKNHKRAQPAKPAQPAQHHRQPTPPASPTADNFLITIPTAQTDGQADDDKVKCKFCSFHSDNLIELNRHEEEAHKDASEQHQQQQAQQPPTIVPGTFLAHLPGTNRQIILRPQQPQQQHQPPQMMTVLRPGLTQTLLPASKTITLPVATSQPPVFTTRPAFLPAQPNQPPLTVQTSIASVVPTPAIQQPRLWRCPYCEVQVIAAPLLKQHLRVCPSRLKEEGNQQAPSSAVIPCPFCEHEAKSRELLGQHLLQREKQRCPEENCPQVFCEPADYKRHIKTTHYQCLRCVFNSNVEAAFRQHFLQQHAGEAAAASAAAASAVAGTTTNSASSSPPSSSPSSNGVTVAKLMPITAATARNTPVTPAAPSNNPAAHALRPNKAANFRCPFCATVMPAKENWIAHLRAAHAERAPTVCHVCTMVFANGASKTVHFEASHPGETDLLSNMINNQTTNTVLQQPATTTTVTYKVL